MSTVTSPEIWHRDDFALLCNWRRLWRAVEIGVDRAEFAHTFLERWQGYAYYGVDPYTLFHDIPDCRDGDYAMAAIRFERHAKKARLLKCRSLDFAKRIQSLTEQQDYLGFFNATPREHRDSLVDFVYLDGDHTYPAVLADIGAWWPILSTKGILAGHDFDNRWGVEQAVREFAEKNHLTVYLTEDWPQSWYIYRSGIPNIGWVRNLPTGEDRP